jgi:ABC-type dipeptide/oligopeptide/nickel transport system permease component
MISYIIRRTAYALLILFLLSMAVFFIIHLIPGDPVQIFLGERYSEDTYRAWRKELGLDDPIIIQYIRYIRNVINGDLGISFRTHTPVAPLLFAAIGKTIQLAAAAFFVATVIGIPLGVLAAVKWNTFWDRSAMSFAIIGVSAPYFWVGILLIYIFAVHLGWFPTYGATQGILSIVLPSITLGTNYAAMMARLTRSSLLDTLQQEYITTARSKGLKETIVIFRHAMKNALLPIVTLSGLQLSMLLSGSLVTESVFAWPGIGRMVIVAVQARDIPSVQAVVLFMGGFVTIINLAVDLLYGFLDPRIHYD